jgi:hypothetical protein
VIHAGAFEQHIFHLHNHQWLFNPNDDNANYLDAQEIMPGSGHTYELVNGGIGNRNKTAGDAIFHCHFYPHFAQGMWYHIRIQDMFERGTVLAVSNAADPQNPPLFDPLNPQANFHTANHALRSGQPAAGSRALPDGELPGGWPIPAIVPLPGKAMPQMPAKVTTMAVDRGDFGVLSGRRPPNGLGQGPDSAQAVVDFASVAGVDGILHTADDVNPGYPFWLAGNTCGVGGDLVTGACPDGTVGQRMMTPVLDMLTEAGATANSMPPGAAGGWDGGLPRHNLRGYTSGGVSLDTQNRLDFRKVVEIAQPVYYPEIGTDLERVAMAHHSVRNRPSYANDLVGTGTTQPDWVANGMDPLPGGPFNDPCVDDAGMYLDGTTASWFDGDNNPATLGTQGASAFTGDNPRTYKIANVQIDAVFNKVGHHYAQERIIALWEDVAPTIAKQRPPEPLIMRFNTFDCGKILHSNLVPAEYELDDFQVRTPTDIIGQHIHLPKWDLTTGDGAGNGWNYEDGALSPGMVDERIHAINNFNALAGANTLLTDALALLGIEVNPILAAAVANHQINLTDLAAVPTIDTGDPGAGPQTPGHTYADGLTHLEALPHPFFGAGVGGEYLGARTVIQRILVDPIVNVAGQDRGLGLTFSHDHYGPSTFQQIGLYSTILAEPAGSTWVHNESGVQIGWLPDGNQGAGRDDGGPTSWQVAIVTPDAAPNGSTVGSEAVEDHREFYFEMSDFQHAYNAGVYVGAGPDGRPVLTQIDQPDPFNVTVAFAPALQDTWQQAVNPPLKLKAAGGFPDIVTAEAACPGAAGNFDPNVPRPCAEAINIAHESIWVINYRNEPVGQRVFDPNALGVDGNNGAQAAGFAGDLAFALQSRTDRAIPELNTSFGNTPYPSGNAWTGNYCSDPAFGDMINCDRQPGDPFTPMMRAFERDHVKIKIQVGATEEQHQTTVHGIKWLSNGSGFGRSGNSGWRNFQSHGISEQFSLQVPVTFDPGAQGNQTDYLYATDATRPGFWLGTWGVLRAYRNNPNDLFELPDNPMVETVFTNEDDFVGVCPEDQTVPGRPRPANLVEYRVTAVLANQVLPNNLGAVIPANTPVFDPGPDGILVDDPNTVVDEAADNILLGGDSDGDGFADNAGGPLNPAGGTLVYNRRGTNVPDAIIIDPDAPGGQITVAGGDGPLNDPTAILYFRDEDLVFDEDTDQPIGLQPGAPVEPLVLRANAGDCIEVTLHNALPAVAPDLAGWQDMMWAVTRRIQGAGINAEMYFFNNNLIRPSSYVGLHAQLVEYDASKDDGVLVGQNDQDTLVAPGEQHVYRWYAGDLRQERNGTVEVGQGNNRREVPAYDIIATPVEFGASNLLSADRIKQPQKGMFGALSILPAGSVVDDSTLVPDGQGSGTDTRLTRAQVTVTSPAGDAGSGGTFREALQIGHKIANLRWADGTAIKNIHQGELGREGAEDSGHAGFNYAMEPSWFRFKLPPDVPFGNAGAGPATFGGLPNAHAMYANDLVAGEPNSIPLIPGVSAAGDPVTPVFRVAGDTAGANPVWDTRMHVLNGASADRDGTFILHGHLWQRDPFVCTGASQDATVPLPGRCDPNEPVPAQALGVNPQGKWMGSEEGMGHVYGHWPILFDAGGTDTVLGDYLYRDYSPSGNRNGQFGILRVE